MNPKPIYRSVTFWSGILVMGFICFCARDSTRHTALASYDEVWVMNARYGLSATRTQGQSGDLKFSREPWLPGTGVSKDWLFREGTRFYRREDHNQSLPSPNITDSAFDAGVSDIIESGEAGNWVLFIPHWLLLLAVALPWSGLLVWRAGRMRKAKGILVRAEG